MATTETTPKAKKKYSKPWEPARRLKVDLVPGKRLKWVDTKTEGKLERHLKEDWQVSHDKHPELARVLNTDASKIGSVTEIPGMILCEMEEERAQERDQHWRNRVKTATRKPAGEFGRTVKDAGQQTFGDAIVGQGETP